MDLPIELQQPPPRDPAAAGALLAQNRKAIVGTIVGMSLLSPLLLVLGMVVPRITGMQLKGLTPESAPWVVVIVDLFLSLFIVAFVVQLGRARRLFCEGHATFGRVVKITAPNMGSGKATYIFVDVTWTTMEGRPMTGKATTTGNKIRCQEGEEVPLLYLRGDPTKFALYDPELGMVPGVGKA